MRVSGYLNSENLPQIVVHVIYVALNTVVFTKLQKNSQILRNTATEEKSL
jgi:hypothetical protein